MTEKQSRAIDFQEFARSSHKDCDWLSFHDDHKRLIYQQHEREYFSRRSRELMDIE